VHRAARLRSVDLTCSGEASRRSWFWVFIIGIGSRRWTFVARVSCIVRGGEVDTDIGLQARRAVCERFIILAGSLLLRKGMIFRS